MDAPTPPPDAPQPDGGTPSPRRQLSRRALFKLAGWAAGLGFTAEALRVLVFNNVHEVVPGRVYRSAQLTEEELREFIAEKGIRTIVNLRGVCADTDWYRGECRAAHEANANQEDLWFSAKRFPAQRELLRLIDVLDHTAYPLVFHCMRGADRTGMASTVARLLLTGDSLPAARRQLWPRYGHMAVGRTAVLDGFFDYYAMWLGARGEPHSPERFRGWVQDDYCPGPYRAELSLIGPPTGPAGRGFTVAVRAVNTSVEPWEFMPGTTGGIRLMYGVNATVGTYTHRAQAGRLARVVHPGESIDLACGLPPLPAGNYHFVADLFEAEPIELMNITFGQHGSEPLEVSLAVG
jgi:hypothetical protein